MNACVRVGCGVTELKLTGVKVTVGLGEEVCVASAACAACVWVNAAEKVAERIRARAAKMLSKRGDGPEVDPGEIHLEDGKAFALDGRSVTFSEIGHHSLHHSEQEQIMGVGSYVSPVAPPPFAAQFAEVTVDERASIPCLRHHG